MIPKALEQWLFSAVKGCVLVLTVSLALGVEPARAFARPPEPWSGPRGAHVFAEAEQFEFEGEGWNVVESRRGFYVVIASGMKALSGAGPGEGKATLTIEVPSAGDYRLWVRYAQWQVEEDRGRGSFRVTVEQAGEKALEEVYDERLDVKTSGGTGGQAPFRWQAAPVTLAKGPGRVVISKVGPAAVDRRVRQIDCMLLTTDADYEPDYRDFAPQTYLRARLRRAVPERVYFYVFLDHMRSPWYQNICWAKDGLRLGVHAPREQYLAAGDATSWMNISRLLYTDSVTGFSVHATVSYRQPDASVSDYSLDFATAPEQSAIVKTVRRTGPGNGVQIVVPPDLAEGKSPKADVDYAREVAEFIARLEPIGFGRKPKRFPLMLNLGTSKANNNPEARDLEFRAISYMGINAVGGHINDDDIADGVLFGRTGASIWHMGPAGYNEPRLERIEQSIKASGESLAKDPHADALISAMLMDEAGAKGLVAMAGSEVDQRAFREWIKDRRLTPQGLGVDSWQEVKLTADPGVQPSALYYWSQRFRAWSVANFFRQATELVHKYYPPHVKATQNYSDGAVWMANFYVQGNDYYVWFKNRALDLAMSEDWTNGGATQQLCGWNVALLRSAVKYHHQPIHMYVITSFGRRPLDVKLKAYSDLAQGAKMLQFYSYAPIYSSHEPGWHQNWTMYPAVAEICHEIGAAEDVLIDAVPRPAQTAIIYSVPYDIWNVSGDNSQGHERMMTYLALRHAQVAVDVLSDEDVSDGFIAPYKVGYLFGEQISRQAIQPLATWVKGGGTLVLSPGAGSRDQLNQSTDALDTALGISREPMNVLQAYAHSSYYYVQGVQSKGKVRLLGVNGEPGSTVDLLAHSQRFSAHAGAAVLAGFEDGKPAALSVNVEKGRVVLVGFMPAVAYVRGAVLDLVKTAKGEEVHPLQCVARAMAAVPDNAKGKPRNPLRQSRLDYSSVPFRYDASLRGFITLPHALSGVVEPVQSDAPQVEATFMEGVAGWAVPLANYTGAPLEKLTVTIRPGRPCEDVFSARQGQLQAAIAPDGSLQVTIPLESTDIIYARWEAR